MSNVGDDNFEKILTNVRKKVNSKNFDGVLDALRDAEKINSDNEVLYHYFYKTHRDASEYHLAFLSAQKIISINPKNKWGYRWASEMLPYLKEKEIEFDEGVIDAVSNLKLSDLVILADVKTYTYWWSLLRSVYRYQLQDMSFKNRKKVEVKRAQKRVFVVANHSKENSTSSHLRTMALFCRTFRKAGVESSLLLTQGPYPGLGKVGSIGMPKEPLSSKLIEDRVCHFSKMVAGEDINVEVLHNTQDQKKSVSEYINEVKNSFLEYDIGEGDVVLMMGGIIGSNIFVDLLRGLKAVVIFVTNSGYNKVDDVYGVADYVVLHNLKHEYFINRIKKVGYGEESLIQRVIVTKPFYWERSGEVSFTDDEVMFVKELSGVKPVLISAALNYERRINEEFVVLLRNIFHKSELLVGIIGTNEEKFFLSAPQLEPFKDRFVFLDYSPHIFSVFEMISKFNSVYLFPRNCGSGLTNRFAALANIPVVLFAGNDAANGHPDELICNNIEQACQLVMSIINSSVVREDMVGKTSATIENNELEYKNYCLKFLDLDKIF